MADCTIVSIDECVKRGDTKSFDIIIPGKDLTTSDVFFTGKQNRNLDSGRYIDLSNAAGGRLGVVFNSPDTTITVELIPEDTQDITFDTLQVDIQVDDPLDDEDIITVADGTLSIISDVRTPFDNFPLPDTAVTYQQVDAEDFETNEMMIVGEVNSVKFMLPITLVELKALLEALP